MLSGSSPFPTGPSLPGTHVPCRGLTLELWALSDRIWLICLADWVQLPLDQPNAPPQKTVSVMELKVLINGEHLEADVAIMRVESVRILLLSYLHIAPCVVNFVQKAFKLHHMPFQAHIANMYVASSCDIFKQSKSFSIR